MLPSDASCTLLGGFMLSLLIIPFMSPLLDDAIQNVPHTMKEASFALGANRWHTLKSITIPYALPGIINALILGILTALGEAIIVAYTIGFGARTLPSPIFDLLQRTAPLTSTIAGLSAGGLTQSQDTGPIGLSVASLMGLLLLLAAFVLLGVSIFLQRKSRKGLP
jgi:phosphate transport system permease protein